MAKHRTAVFCVLLFTAGGQPAGQAPATGWQEPPGAADSRTGYRGLIRRLEIDHGPYDQRLSEPLLGLGLSLYRQGDYDGASAILQRAMHVTRVNEGLYSRSQLPILDLIIKTDAALGNWQGVNRGFNYFHWLQRRSFDADDPRQLRAIETMKAWHLAAINLSTGVNRARHLLQVKQLCQLALDISERRFGREDPRLAGYLYQLALAEYYLAVAIQRGGPLGLELVAGMRVITNNAGYQEISDRLTARNYRRGMDILARIEALYAGSPDTAPITAAMLTLYTADWHLLFNRHKPAVNAYRQAYVQLSRAGIPGEELDAYFHRPAILPEESLRERPDLQRPQVPAAVTQVSPTGPAPETIVIENYIAWSHDLPGLRFPQLAMSSVAPVPDHGHASAAFRLGDKGWAEDIRIADYHPHDRVTRARAYEAVWSIQFRPRLVGGRAAGTGSVVLNYVIPEKI